MWIEIEKKERICLISEKKLTRVGNRFFFLFSVKHVYWIKFFLPGNKSYIAFFSYWNRIFVKWVCITIKWNFVEYRMWLSEFNTLSKLSSSKIQFAISSSRYKTKINIDRNMTPRERERKFPIFNIMHW